MVSKGRKAAKELRRRKPIFDARLRVLIVCEGIVTEKEYFEAFRRRIRAAINVIVDDNGGTPKTLVERAVSEKRKAAERAHRDGDSGSAYDEIWCVFDIDEHPFVQDARVQAAAHKIKLAITNPCFELWFLLHFRDQTAYIDRQELQSVCREFIPGYRKSAPAHVLDPRYDSAVERAARLEARNKRDGEPDRNPSTNVHVLLERLRELAAPRLHGSTPK